MYVCVCVCVCERERERERVSLVSVGVLRLTEGAACIIHDSEVEDSWKTGHSSADRCSRSGCSVQEDGRGRGRGRRVGSG